MEIALAHDFQEFLRLLKENEVEYLLIGGYAVAYHGYPRFTGDLDIWLRPTPDNAQRVVAALQDFGIVAGVSAELFTKPSQIVRVGVKPLLLELFSSIPGVEFEACYSRRDTPVWNGTPVDVIGFDDLLTNKRASGRLKDRADLEMLE